MSSDYSYDNEGQFFPFFILTLTGLVTVPLTYTLLRPSRDDDALAPRIKTDYKPDNAATVESIKTARKRSQWRVKRAIFVVIGWAVMAGMGYLIVVTQRTVPKLWNPYDILGISESLSEKQIKSHYKRLSLKFHPDKVRPDAAKNETVESLNDFYVELTKAYQALTDEDVRNNYIQYGHPDGKQSFSMGIALPQFIVSDGAGKYVVLMYTLLLGVLLPWLVGSWWYGTMRMSKEGVLMESANNLFRQYDDEIEEGGIITALSVGKELEDVVKSDKIETALSKIESRITADSACQPTASGMSVKDKEALQDLDNGARRKALALLWAYLGRVELDDPALTKAKFQVGPIARALNQSFNAITLAYGNIGPIANSFYTSQNLVQAVAPHASPLLQLPHITPEIASKIEGESKTHMAVHRFMDRPDAQRRQMAIGEGLLTEEQYETAIGVAKQIPFFRVCRAFFKVTGERFIIPSSLVSLVIKGRFIPPGTDDVPGVNELDLEDVDPAEDDIDAINGRKKKTIKGPDGKLIPIEEESILPPLTHAPYYARDHSPQWHAFLSDSKQGKMAVPPFHFAKFDQPIIDDEGKPTFNMQTLKAQFAAPPQAGHYTFVLHVICDAYVGFDTKMEVTLVVEEASKAAEMQAEDDISEPEEDSLAGQMHQLKTGQAPKTKTRRKDSDDSDDESGTDEEEDDDSSATNTDTEDES
ncbi:Sec63 Brl domain-containing protein [Fusarium flagelliforme]|uniref:Translocation protein sec63 n=1 Tax=Fusarium flagelliforme TaxID=2675880 RepID=A0A395MZ12_9HYPO|nr:Sec63 Brl domain-containing protein [Fusarium flagelliforme]KAH7188312.1 Sec63 Brl domain-containing protein [Fusarium flagelliforme]RFN52905.1 translocation protein sec63 [Fusarium flagelliforme]